MLGNRLEVAPAHAGEDFRHGQEAAVVHLPTMVEDLAVEAALSIGLATDIAVLVSSSDLCYMCNTHAIIVTNMVPLLQSILECSSNRTCMVV